MKYLSITSYEFSKSSIVSNNGTSCNLAKSLPTNPTSFSIIASSNKSETLVVCEIMFCLITLSPSLSFNFLAVLNIANSFLNSSDCLFSSRLYLADVDLLLVVLIKVHIFLLHLANYSLFRY